MIHWIFIILLFYGCDHQKDSALPFDFTWQVISGRDESPFSPTNGSLVPKRLPIYRAKVPISWVRQNPSEEESIADTMKPLCTYYIDHKEDQLRITIHNFPTNSMEEQTAPASQIARWKQQFDRLDPTDIMVMPLASGGFAGLYFEGKGTLQAVNGTVMGWSMQMAPEQYQNLQANNHVERQRRADYTIKAQGDPKIMAEKRNELHFFANSFELIEEISTR